MDVDNINIEEDIYEFNDMNNIYNDMLIELDKKVAELTTINNKIDYIDSLKIQKSRYKNKINKEKKKWINREFLIIILLIPFLFAINPIIPSILIFISLLIANKVYIEKTKDYRIAINSTVLTDDYQELIIKRHEINDELTKLRRNIHTYKKQINLLMKDINFVQSEFYGYDHIIKKLSDKKSNNDENYCYILKKY